MYTLTNTLLSLRSLTVSYGTKVVLRDVNLEIKDIVDPTTTRGQVVTLMAKSGAGKTTLLKTIAGMIKPTSGTILIGIDQKPVMTGEVGMVLQTYPLMLHRTLLSNLTLVSKDQTKINQYLADFELWDHRNKYPRQLSGGQRQRAAIVQQLLCSCHFILLDEPFSGLDPVATDRLCNFITLATNMDEQNTTIISSHILEPSIAISDKIWLLGQQTGGDGQKIEGTTVIMDDDLAAQGLAWNPDIRRDPRFTHKIEDIRSQFHLI